jgi:hypothetical protein
MPSNVTRLLAIAPLALLLSACSLEDFSGLFSTFSFGTKSRPAVVDTTCATMRPIYWHSQDTDDTVAQAKAHNAALVELCPEFTPRSQ